LADDLYCLFKRPYDTACSVLGILVLLPVGLVAGLLIKLCDGGPVFCREIRIGQFGIPFRIWKFRLTVAKAEPIGPGITNDGDARTTRVGRFLRKTRLDGAPQLWNVLRGDMSMVGPRPELPRYVERYTTEQRKVLWFKPGITDLAALEFRNEEELLSGAADGGPVGSEAVSRSAKETERVYVEYCLPKNIALSLAYGRRASLWTDSKLIARTICALRASRH